MTIELRETRLPGVGVKYGFRTGEGARLAIILHNDGDREIYFFRHEDDEDPAAVIRLDDDEARQLGAVLGGAYERPKIVEELEMALGELLIEWVRVPDDEPRDREVARRLCLPGADGYHDHRHPPRARAGDRRAAGRCHPGRRHARNGREGWPVQGLPRPARRRPVLGGALRPGDELAAAVRTDLLHRLSARRAERALVGADERRAAGREPGPASLARRPHLQPHGPGPVPPSDRLLLSPGPGRV